MSSKERIVTMLAAGVKPVNIAAAIGVDASYVSQVAAENEEQISEERSKRAVNVVEHDMTLDAMEDRSLQKVGRLLDGVTDPMKALAVFKVLNGARRRSEAANAAAVPATVVQIELPEVARVAIKVTTNNQVIEVAGRSMLTMQAKTVEDMLVRRQEEKKKTVELLEDSSHLQQMIPANTLSLLESL